MIERLRALLDERAAAIAERGGVPVAAVHVHGAAHQLIALVSQAKEDALREMAPKRVIPPAVAMPDPVPTPDSAPKRSRKKATT